MRSAQVTPRLSYHKDGSAYRPPPPRVATRNSESSCCCPPRHCCCRTPDPQPCDCPEPTVISSCGVLTVLPLVFNTQEAQVYPEELGVEPLVTYTPISPTSGTLTFFIETDTPPGNVRLTATPHVGPNGELNILNIQSSGFGEECRPTYTLVFTATTPAFDVIAITTTQPCCQECGR